MPPSKKVKPLSPLQAMTLGTLSSSVKLKTKEHELKPNSSDGDQIIVADPNRICNWLLHDRPESELGDISTLAKEMKEIGQQQPCIVRPYTDSPEFDYEVIAGERRWRAAILAEIKLKVIVKELSDKDACLCQAAENSQREDLSDYARGVSYAKMIQKGLLSRTDLQEKLNVSKSQIRNLLSYIKIPSDVWTCVINPSKISAAAAYEISRTLEKGPIYKEAVMQILKSLGNRGINDKKLAKLVEQFINKIESKSPNIENSSPFKLKLLNNGNLSIELEKKYISDLASFEAVNNILKEQLEQYFKQLVTKEVVSEPI